MLYSPWRVWVPCAATRRSLIAAFDGSCFLVSPSDLSRFCLTAFPTSPSTAHSPGRNLFLCNALEDIMHCTMALTENVDQVPHHFTHTYIYQFSRSIFGQRPNPSQPPFILSWAFHSLHNCVVRRSCHSTLRTSNFGRHAQMIVSRPYPQLVLLPLTSPFRIQRRPPAATSHGKDRSATRPELALPCCISDLPRLRLCFVTLSFSSRLPGQLAPRNTRIRRIASGIHIGLPICFQCAVLCAVSNSPVGLGLSTWLLGLWFVGIPCNFLPYPCAFELVFIADQLCGSCSVTRDSTSM